jgi:hypothetical protein
MTRKTKSNERLIIIGGAFSLAAGFGAVLAWRVGKALSDNDIRLLVGGCGVLAVVLTVGALFVAWSASQSRLRRQELQQDDLDELKKMALILKMGGGGRAPTINVKPADTPQLPAPPMVWPYPVQQEQGQLAAGDGDYRDSINIE